MPTGRLGSATIAVVTMTDDEFAAVSARFGAATNIGGTPYFVEQVAGDGHYRWVIRRTADRGNQPCSQAVASLVEDFWPRYFLLVGSAGGIAGRDGIALGDVVIADYVEYGEFKKVLPGGSRSRKVAYDHPALYLRESFAEPLRRGETWIDEIQPSRPAAGRPKALVGNILAGEKIWGDPDSTEQRELLETFDKVLVVETESYGIARELYRARGRHDYNPQYAVIRGVSDIVNAANNDATRKQWTAYAVGAAAAFAFCLAQSIVAMPDPA